MATAWPTLSLTPSRQSWSLMSNTQVHVSPFDGTVQTQPIPGAKWSTTVEYNSLMAADAMKLQAFLASLGGRAGRVLVGNFGQPYPRGAFGGTPLVNGTPYLAGTSSIGTDGWTPGATMLAGDFFGLEGRLYQLNATATANGSGQMTITFSPPLRVTPLDNAPLTLVSPTTTMMLVDDMQGWTYGPGSRRGFAIDLVEVL